MNIYAMKKPKKLNAVSVTIGILVIVFGYLTWFLLPVYWPFFQMSGIMRTACIRAFHDKDDKKLLKKMVDEAGRTGLKVTADNFRFTRILYDDAELVGNPIKEMLRRRGKSCRVEFVHEHDYKIPLTGKTWHKRTLMEQNIDLRELGGNESLLDQCSCDKVIEKMKS